MLNLQSMPAGSWYAVALLYHILIYIIFMHSLLTNLSKVSKPSKPMDCVHGDSPLEDLLSFARRYVEG